jgi:hypothetical protein
MAGEDRINMSMLVDRLLGATIRQIIEEHVGVHDFDLLKLAIAALLEDFYFCGSRTDADIQRTMEQEAAD